MDPSLASSITGYLSILCWLIVFTPQLWENYRRKSGDGLSMTFLVIWLAGDVFNLLGVIMQDLLVTMVK
ncbi:Putative FAFR605Cp [Rhizopus microsporus]|nr:Putative FAFR605Cp [Rhizopus microsporus]